jgi:hypothetical protein
MNFNSRKFALICGATFALTTALLAAQKDSKASTNPPASPQAKKPQPATHFTQGTITSIQANQMVITRKIRGKAEQVTFAINSQTQQSGHLVPGTRVSVQYREQDHQNVAAAVRERAAEAAAKPIKATKPASKS